MSFARRSQRANATEGFAFGKPTRPAKSASRLARRSWIKRRSPRRIARETPAEREHKALIREARVCAAAKYAGSGQCRGPLHVAHLGRSGGTWRKHGDWTETSLMCMRHHRALDERLFPFSDMSAGELVAWKEREIALARDFVAGRRTVSG